MYCNWRSTTRCSLFRHIHNRHQQQDCQYYNCWSYGVQVRNISEYRRYKRSVQHAITICQYNIEDEDPTDSWKELHEDQRWYAYLVETDCVTSQNQNAGSKIDLKILHTDPTIIPLEAAIPQADPRLHTDIHFCNSSNSNQANQATKIWNTTDFLKQ